MLRLNTIIVLIFFCLIVGFSSQFNTVEMRYLATKSSEKTSYWTQHFIKRLPKLGLNLQDHKIDPIMSTIAVGNAVGLAKDIVESSELFQIDYLNPDCLCAISIGSYASKSSNKIKTEPISRGLAKAVFFGQYKGRTHGRHVQNNQHQFPVNFQHAKTVLDNGSNDIFIFKSDRADLPKVYAAVYQIVRTDNQATLLIRTLVPLVKEAQLFFVMWYCVYSALIIALLAAIYNAFKKQDQQFHPINNTFSMCPKHRSIMFFGLFFLAFVGVLVGSYFSPDFHTIWEYSHDKIKHMIAYFSLTAMGFAALHRFDWSRNLVLIIFIVGVLIEITQPFVGRSASLHDLIANSIGIGLGSLVASWCGFKKNFKQDTHTIDQSQKSELEAQ